MHNQDTFTGPSFSFLNRLFRLVWNFVFIFFFRFSPKPFHSWRSFLLRLFGAKVGKGVHVYPNVKIWAPWNLELGDQCGVANNVNLYSQDRICIGIRTVISQGTYLCAGTHDYTKVNFPLISKPIIIGDYCWIAAEAFVHPGIIIGDGAVIGARSVVVSNIPEWTVCTGFPCVPIKKRILE